MVKGVLTGEDAELAIEHGADAVWVSNHGGRQLDYTPSTVILPDVFTFILLSRKIVEKLLL